MAETVASDWNTAGRAVRQSHQQRTPLELVILIGPRMIIP